MRSVDEILDKLKQFEGLTRDAELARLFNVKPSTVSSWRTRGNLPLADLAAFCEERKYNLSWLLTGQITTRHMDADGNQVVTGTNEPGIFKLDSSHGVADGQSFFYINIRDEVAAHNAQIISRMLGQLERIINEGDYRKTSSIQGMLDVLDPGEQEGGNT